LEKLSKYDVVYIPIAEFMPAEMQEAIIELLKKGVTVIACGLMPKYDENFHECQILSRHLRIKTTLGCGIDCIKTKNNQFSTYVYGHILSPDSKVKKLATTNKKNVGVASSKYKGTFYLFSFNIGSDCDHNKMSYIEGLLAENEISSGLYCSNPSIDMAIQKGEKKAVFISYFPAARRIIGHDRFIEP